MSQSSARAAWEVFQTFALALVLALILRAFFIESFVVDGSSMEETLQDGERVLVNKLAYRIGKPERGDIVVFRAPPDGHRDFIKRVIAVEGDTVELRDGKAIVNGRSVEEDYLDHSDHSEVRRQVVPDRYLFVLGDNRANSEDSRYFGFIPVSSMKGKAFFVWWPLSAARVPR